MVCRGRLRKPNLRPWRYRSRPACGKLSLCRRPASFDCIPTITLSKNALHHARAYNDRGAPLFLQEAAFFVNRCLLRHFCTTCELCTKNSVRNLLDSQPHLASRISADMLACCPHRSQAVTSTIDPHVELEPPAMPLLPPPRSGPVRRVPVLSKSQSWQMHPPRHGWKRLCGVLPQSTSTDLMRS